MIRHWVQLRTSLGLPESKTLISQWVGAFGELCVASRCVACSKFAANGWACEACLAGVEFSNAGWCKVCAMPDSEPHSPGCRHSRKERKLILNHMLPWAEARCLGAYAGVIRSTCLSGKTPAGVWASAHLVKAWWARHAEWAAAIGPAWLVPIPRHWSRRWLVGHDPAQFLATALAERWSRLGGRAAGLLVRRHATPHLSGLSAENRFRVMAGLFRASRDAATKLRKNPCVVLVDDIWTSGATAISAAQCLLNAGAKSIYLATMARTLEQHI